VCACARVYMQHGFSKQGMKRTQLFSIQIFKTCLISLNPLDNLGSQICWSTKRTDGTEHAIMRSLHALCENNARHVRKKKENILNASN